MTNMSILQQNIISSLENEEAKAAFLRAQDRPEDNTFSYWAEHVAREVDALCSFLKPAIDAASRPFCANNEVKSDLLSFILKRHWHSVTGAA